MQEGDGDAVQGFAPLTALVLPPLLQVTSAAAWSMSPAACWGAPPRRQCGRKGSPYHTGQLHPAVRVADLLQHINQMKTAEGYGFKQEYEVRALVLASQGGQEVGWTRWHG